MRKGSATLACALALTAGSMTALAAQEASEAQSPPITLRIAANVPASSPWDLGLKRLALEFDRISAGRVRLIFPSSARVGTEEDNLRRLRLGLDGAMLSSQGLAELYPDSLALSLPGYITDDEEFDAALAAVRPLIRAKLSDRYAVLAVSKGGWIRYFSNSPIVYPADLTGLRVSIEAGNDRESRLLTSLGCRLVPGTIADFILQSRTKGVDGICQSPIYIATLWFELRKSISYMSAFKVAPFVGAMVFNKASWERVPPELRPALEAAVQSIADEIGIEGAKLEAEAIASLDGIKVRDEPPDTAAKWAEAIAQRRAGLIARMFSPDMLAAMDGALSRQGGRGKD